MPVSPQLKALVDQMPDPDERGMYCTNIDKEKIEKALAEIHQGGRPSLLGLIDLLVAPGEGDDVKAHYALHGLALHVCQLEDRKHRREFAEVLVSQLDTERPKSVKAYLMQELQTAGGPEAAAALGKFLTDEELGEPAACAIMAIGPVAVEQFRAALPQAKGKCRLTILMNLGLLRDVQAVEPLKKALDDEDREIRIIAAWALANIGDAGSVDRIVKAAETEGWERIQAAKSCLLLAERLLAGGMKDEAKKIYVHLSKTRSDPSERYIREVADKALAVI